MNGGAVFLPLAVVAIFFRDGGIIRAFQHIAVGNRHGFHRHPVGHKRHRPLRQRAEGLNGVGLTGADAVGVVGGGREVPEMPLTGNSPPGGVTMLKSNAYA